MEYMRLGRSPQRKVPAIAQMRCLVISGRRSDIPLFLARDLRALHRIPPFGNDHLSAVRLAISIAAPSLTLLLWGAEVVIYAAFGALTAMYGRNERHQLRMRHQAQAALALLTGVGTGVLLPVNWLICVETLLVGAGSVFSDRVKLEPHGPFFAIRDEFAESSRRPRIRRIPPPDVLTFDRDSFYAFPRS